MSLRVLFAHSRYQQRGGEDQVVDAEMHMLRQRGHEVTLYEQDNKRAGEMSRISLAAKAVWSRETSAELKRLAAEFEPDVIHVHNTLPLVSPSVFWTAAELGIPVVYTLHNFRLICPQAMLLRESKPCEKCVGRIPWPAVRHRCYRDSAGQSAVLAGSLAIHRALGTYRRHVDAYIALSDFSRRKFIDGGLPPDRIHVKPNFTDIDYQPAATHRSKALFVGRLYPEKGLQVLADAAALVPDISIDVVGAGPLEAMLAQHRSFSLRGWLSAEAVQSAMRSASYLVVPSIWHETFGLIVIEAFANGLPVIASRMGALQELIDDGVTGLLVEPGSAQDIADKMAWAESHPEELAAMGARAREVYEQKYTSTTNYQKLHGIYSGVVEQRL